MMITATPKLTPEIKLYLAKLVSQVLSDPDFGLELSAKVQKRLANTRRSGGRTISLAEVKKRYL